MHNKNRLAAVAGWLALIFHPTTAVTAAESGTAGAVAQQTGSVSGQVSNVATGVVLGGVIVSAQGTDFSTMTERDGTYRLHLPAGDYTLTAAYTGLDPQSIPLSIRAGSATRRDIGLTSGIYKLEKYTVLGEREGSSLAITQQRNAPNVKNVLSADTFGNIADQNIGNFLKFVPGVSFNIGESEVTSILIRGVADDLNSVTVDGTRVASGTVAGGLVRSIDISRLSADFVESVEVTKSATPDMDADSIGGAINLRSKSAFDRNQRVISLTAGTSYNVERKTFRPLGSVTYSDVLGDSRKWGVLFTASYTSRHSPRDQARTVYEPTTETNRPIWFDVAFAGEDILLQKRLGLNLRLDYKITEAHRVYLNPMYSWYENNLFRRRLTTTGITAARVTPGWTDTITNTFNHAAGFDQNYRISRNETDSLQAGGESRFERGKLDYSANYSASTGKDHRDVLSRSVAGVGFRFDRSRSRRFPDMIQTSGPDVMNPANSPIGALNFQDDAVDDRIWGAQINYRQQFETAAPASVKAGWRYRKQERAQDINRDQFTYIGPDRASGRFIDRGYTHQPAGVYPAWPFVDIPLLTAELKNNPSQFTHTAQNSLLSDVEANEEVNAGYILGDLKLGRLSLLAGVRVEETRVKGIGVLQELTPAEVARRAAFVGTLTDTERLRRFEAEFGRKQVNEASYRDVFPSVHFKYELNRGLQARLSWSTGIGRPNFNQIIPSTAVDHARGTVSTSNVNLKPQHADNFDASLEYYFEPIGMVSAGVFLKEIRDFIYSSNGGVVGAGENNGFGGDYVGYQLTTNFNGGSARIRGVELAYQQQLSQFSPLLHGFAVFANYTWLESLGNYGNVGGPVLKEAPVTGFTPRTGNAGLSYIRHQWSIRAKLNYGGGNKIQQWADNPLTRQYQYDYKSLDVNIHYNLTPRWGVYVDAINALKAPQVDYYEYVPERPRATTNQVALIKFGVDARF